MDAGTPLCYEICRSGLACVPVRWHGLTRGIGRECEAGAVGCHVHLHGVALAGEPAEDLLGEPVGDLAAGAPA